MQIVKLHTSKLHRFWLAAVLLLVSATVLISSFTLSKQVVAATAKPISSASPATDILSKGGIVKWLYYGNIRIDNNKKGDKKKVWDYALNPTTGYYEFQGAGYCENDEKKPNDYIVVQDSGSIARFVVLAPEGSQSLDCNRKSQTIGDPQMKARKDALFYQVKGEENTVKMWNTAGDGGTSITFKKSPKSSGWQEIYKRVDDPSSKCSDMIAKTSRGEWIFMPMIEWTDGVKNDYGFLDAAKSEAAASILGNHTLNECRSAPFEVITVFQTGIKNRETLGPAIDYKINVTREKNNADDQAISLCGEADFSVRWFDNAPLYTSTNLKERWNSEYGFDKLKESWEPTTYPDGGGPNWVLSCKRTDRDGGDVGYHDVKIWNTGVYGMTDSSDRRLIDFSHVQLWSYNYSGGASNDGYKADGGVAKIDASEVSGAAQNIDTDPLDDGDDSTDGEETTTCSIDGIGWIVCPVMRFMGKLNDAAFALIANFLTVEPKLLTDPETESAWKTFRDLANVLFVVFFLIILYSQMTGAGISNYGVKKLLPKLIAAAILVNVSYYICQIAVDLSNIFGSSMYGFFKDMPTATDATADFSGGLSWEKVIGYAIAATAAILVALLLAFTLGTAALLAFAMTVIILIARKAALILLVVISPLAFVAYLLPNTESWFKKWWKMFSTLLMVFPIIGVVFGASTLAARIINNSAGNPDDSSILLQLTALGILAVPLFAVPILLKGATAAMGTIGQKLSGWQDRANSAATNKGKERWGNTAYMRGRAARKAGKEHYRDEKFAKAVNDPQNAWQRARRRAALGTAVTPGGKAGQRALSTSATRVADKAYEEEVEGERLKQVGLSNEQVAAIAASGGKGVSEHAYAAALDRIMKTGSFSERQKALEAASTHESETMRARAVQGAAARGDAAVYGKGFGNDIISGKVREAMQAGDADAANKHLKSEIVQNAAAGKVSASDLVHSDSGTALIVDAVNSSGNATALANVHRAADEVAENEHTASKLTTNIAESLGRLR